MKTRDSQEMIREIAELTATSEEVVSQMYAETLQVLCRDARIFDYLPLLAAKRVRETLRAASKGQSVLCGNPVLGSDIGVLGVNSSFTGNREGLRTR